MSNFSLKSTIQFCNREKHKGKRIGLITGCFDVIHLGHIELFQKAKDIVDIVIVGIDNDESVLLSKGKDRPIFKQTIRALVLSELKSVDKVFIISKVIKFNTQKAEIVHEEIIKKIRPDLILSNKNADKFWKSKKIRAKKLGIEFYGDFKTKKFSSSQLTKYF